MLPPHLPHVHRPKLTVAEPRRGTALVEPRSTPEGRLLIKRPLAVLARPEPAALAATLDLN